MKLLILSPEVDTAGLGIGMKRAFDQCAPDWQARAVRCGDTWLRYEPDIEWNRGDAAQTREIERLWDEADVVHIMEHPEAAAWFSGAAHKPIVVQHLGTWFRRQVDVVSAQCRTINALECADMHDLIARAPRLGWLPDIIDPAPLAAIRAREYRPGERIRIAHAPTDRVIKSTAVIAPIIERLASRYPIEFDLIERVPNAECLARKARADIFVDELTLGYGLNALECWSMGIPVVSGIASNETRALMERDFGSLPFLNANASTLESVLVDLITTPNLRAGWAAAGRNHIERFHTPSAVVERALGFYRAAIEAHR